jgi:hypothetical protein
MTNFRKALLAGTALVAGSLTYAQPASAVTIVAEAIFDNGAPVTLPNSSVTDGNFSLNSPVTLGGKYVIGTTGASAYSLLQPYPNFSTQVQVSTPNQNAVAGDTIEIRISEAGLVPGPTPPFPVLIGLTANVLTNFSVQSGYWYDNGGTSFALTTLIAKGTPTFGHDVDATPIIDPTAPYSITADYILTVTNPGDVQSNVTTDLILENVPEPISTALIGTGIAALGFVRARRRKV